MNKLFIVYLLISLFSINNGYTQTGQTLLWGDTMFIGPSFGGIDSNGDLIIAGNDANAQPMNRGFVIKISDNEVINQYFHTDIDSTTGSLYSNVVFLQNNSYLCFGSQYGGWDVKKPAFITLLDSNLNFISETIFDLPTQYSMFGYGYSLIENDTILYAFSPYIQNAGGSQEYDLGFLRVTSSGDTVESRYYHYEFGGQLGGAIEVYDFRKMPDSDKYVVFCEFAQPSSAADYWTFIINPDLSIDTMYNYGESFGFNTNENRPMGYWKEDNTFITGGIYYIDKSDFSLFAANLDLSGNVLDLTLLNQPEIEEKPGITRSITGANDSTIYVVGYDLCFTCNPVTDKAILEVYTVNTALDVLGYNVIAADGYYRASGVLTNDAGDLIVYGTKNVGDTFNYNLFVAQIPREELGLITSVKTDNALVTLPAYPNPSTGKINFRIPEKILKDGIRIFIKTVSGKTVLNKPVNGTGNTIEVNISGLPEGLYTYRITQKENIISQGKFIKQ